MIVAALLGNPNVGKTSLFNHLTGSNQYVGNWPGVTVEKKEGYIDNSIKIVDLPGIYAMDTYSNEEKVSKEFLLRGNPDVIINIVDSSNLNRNLYLTTQLKQFNKPIILVLNMLDVAELKGIKIDFSALSEELEVTVVPVVATKGKGIDKLLEILKSSDFKRPRNNDKFNFKNENEAYCYINEILKNCLTRTKKGITSVTEKIDKVVLNRFLAYPVFLLALILIFKFTFSWVGQPTADALGDFVNGFLASHLKTLLSSASPWFSSFLVDGILAGVGSVIVFFPVIFCLFLGVSFLEDSGYMARGAFIMDKLMRKMGLSGKAFIPLIVGFGCSVPAIMSSKTLESEKDRKLTALLVPLMSCNARLPIYSLFASAFFVNYKTTIVFSLYIMGIAIAFLIGILFKNTIFKKDEEPFIIELPEYNIPEVKSLLLHTWEKAKGFLRKAGTIIFSMSILIWFLSNFNLSGMVEMDKSILASIGNFISPIFSPMGYGNWQSSVALITGIMAKEIVLSTMGIVYSGNLAAVLPHHFTPIAAYSFLVFVLLYTPCISTIATMKKEYGGKMAIFSVTYQLVLAWVSSFLVFRIATLIFS
ncbi:MAG TPA: ferrous iron transport protein B [Clostridium sp.]|jgi:ferrous iron transport protein B|uniref:Ferrous iron transport protein B n=1 Tax=Clostridium lapidicellarium TaxID=3240931 RepID=A0ABV4DW13_9CLOT|nr:ferrous iron transport protein B [uncultured Clostridium sp.]HBC96532.1 ferrous iron transport protein B [Clostridium sp.]